MDETPIETPAEADPEAPPPFDKQAARARYRALMRSWPMRLMFALTGLVIISTWALAVGAAYGPDVKALPGHDLSVAPAACKDCHGRRINNAPAFNHAYAPTCGFCHVQALPPAVPASGRLR